MQSRRIVPRKKELTNFTKQNIVVSQLDINTKSKKTTLEKKGGERNMIDVNATKQKLKESGRTIPGWARSRGLDPLRMATVFFGKTRMKPEEVEALREDDLLVEVEEVMEIGKAA